MALRSHQALFFMAGITFSIPIRAVLSTPQTTFFMRHPREWRSPDLSRPRRPREMRPRQKATDVPGPGECGRVPTPTESKKRAAIPAATLSGVERDPRGQRRILLVPRPGISRSLAQRRQPGRQSRPRDPQHGGSPRLDLLRWDRKRGDAAGRAGVAQDLAVELPLGSVDPRVGPQDRR